MAMLSCTGNDVSKRAVHANGVTPTIPTPKKALIKNNQGIDAF